MYRCVVDADVRMVVFCVDELLFEVVACVRSEWIGLRDRWILLGIYV